MKTYGQAAWMSVFCLMLAGCEKEDPEHLANVAHKVASRAEPLVDRVDAQWIQRFRAGPESAPVPPPAAVPQAEPDTAARVTARLRYEKTLVDNSIQVVASEGGVELKGKVQNAAQKKRAVQLAESTTGVDRVTDSLEVDDKSP